MKTAYTKFKDYNKEWIFELEDGQQLQVHFYMNDGGCNYFTGRAETKGSYVSVTPIEYSDRGGFACFTTTCFTGIKACLVPMNRKSKKQFNNSIGALGLGLFCRLCDQCGVEIGAKEREEIYEIICEEWI